MTPKPLPSLWVVKMKKRKKKKMTMMMMMVVVVVVVIIMMLISSERSFRYIRNDQQRTLKHFLHLGQPALS